MTSNTASPTREGFGIPLIAGYHTHFVPRVKFYTKPSEMKDDGFTSNDPLYKAATLLCSQANKVPKFAIGRCEGAPTQVVKLIFQGSPAGAKHHIDITLPDGTAEPIDYTGTGNLNADAAAFAGLIDNLSLVTATASAETITVTTTAAGTMTTFENWSELIWLYDNTQNPATSIEDDLDAIRAADDTWFGLTLANESEAIVNVAAAWASANKKLMGYTTSDTKVTDSDTTDDVASDLKGTSNRQVYGIYNGVKCPSYAAAAWMGEEFPFLPGGSTWRNKTLSGVPVGPLTTSQRTTLVDKRVSFLQTLLGLAITSGDAKVASGEWIDVVHFLAWQVAEVQFRIFVALVNSRKIPYTTGGTAVVQAAIEGALLAGVRLKGIAEDPAPLVTIPEVSSIDSATRNSRDLPGIVASFQLAGAIHTAGVELVVS